MKPRKQHTELCIIILFARRAKFSFDAVLASVVKYSVKTFPCVKCCVFFAFIDNVKFSSFSSGQLALRHSAHSIPPKPPFIGCDCTTGKKADNKFIRRCQNVSVIPEPVMSLLFMPAMKLELWPTKTDLFRLLSGWTTCAHRAFYKIKIYLHFWIVKQHQHLSWECEWKNSRPARIHNWTAGNVGWP